MKLLICQSKKLILCRRENSLLRRFKRNDLWRKR